MSYSTDLAGTEWREQDVCSIKIPKASTWVRGRHCIVLQSSGTFCTGAEPMWLRTELTTEFNGLFTHAPNNYSPKKYRIPGEQMSRQSDLF